MFDLIFAIVPIIFVIVTAMILYNMVRGVHEWHTNNNSPIEECSSKIVAKREEVTHHHHENHMSTSTTYYVTFEFMNGVRREFHVRGKEYGMLVEGDQGTLRFQGTRYLSFTRN